MSEDNRPVRVAVVDYGLGNLFSVKHACKRVGMQVAVTSVKQEILAADGVLLPGVGAFGDAMQCLERLRLVEVLREAALVGKPVVGICLGMQLLMSESHEFGRHRGLNIIEGDVVRFEQPRGPRGMLKVPQVGWNRVYRPAMIAGDAWQSTPLEGLGDGTSMYFVHSFYARPVQKSDVFALTRYGDVEFCSSVRRGNVLGFQFHPERSGHAGLRLYAQTAEFIRRRQLSGEVRHAA